MTIHTEASSKMAGVARTSIRLLEALADESPSTRFVCYVNGGFVPPPDLAKRKNVEYRTIRKHRTFMLLGPLLARAAGCQVWFSPAYDGFASRLIPQASLIHDMFPFTNPEWFAGTRNEQAKRQIARQVENSRGLLANSQATLDEMNRIFPGSGARCIVVPLALGNLQPSPEKVDRSELRSMGIPFGRYVLTLGTLEPRKNLPALVRAWAALVKTGRHPDVGLVVAGGKGWGDTDLQREIEAFGVADRIHFTGYVQDEDLPLVMAGSELFVFPSLDEGFGIPLLEAMAYGTPVLSSGAGALREVGDDAARYFSATDEASIRDAVDAALAASQERPMWVEKGRNRATEFGWDRAARATLEVLERCA